MATYSYKLCTPADVKSYRYVEKGENSFRRMENVGLGKFHVRKMCDNISSVCQEKM